MSPEVAAAVERLRGQDALSVEQAALFSRVARRDLLSVNPELRALLYGGVLVAMAGVGLLVKQNFERMGPLAIAGALTVAAAGCLLWVERRSSPFSWHVSPSPHFAFEYLLLLGVLLVGADVAYVEAKFTPRGDAWPWHLFVVAGVAAFLSVRYDSRIVLSLALSTFAAWRGVSVITESSLRTNAIGCGLVFLLLAAALVRLDRKAHFEPVATHAGWLLILGALMSGLSDNSLAFGLLLLLVGAAIGVFAFRGARFSLFVLGVLAAYAGLSALLLRTHPGDAGAALWFALTSLAVLGGLLAAHRRLREAA